ncbi:MAG TPA: hypothetical protein VGQ37_04130 [Vicinamibacterales bacterium]|jgi:hypothetical protein|nr:hypothetical protein [Vicinamibacterales bacterium]
MSCCGQRRRALASGPPATAPSRPSPAGAWATAAREPLGAGVALRYRGLGAFTQRSPRTGRLYACGGTGATLQVDAADVDSLLRTRLFTRA